MDEWMNEWMNAWMNKKKEIKQKEMKERKIDRKREWKNEKKHRDFKEIVEVFFFLSLMFFSIVLFNRPHPSQKNDIVHVTWFHVRHDFWAGAWSIESDT